MLDTFCFDKKISLNNPCLIAAWPGMGQVAITAVEYLRHQLDAIPFGEMQKNDYFAPTGASVINQAIMPPGKPKNRFYYAHSSKYSKDIIFFIGSLQPIPHLEYQFAVELITAARDLGVDKVYTAAAAPSDMHIKDNPRVFAAPNHQKDLKQLLQHNVQFMSDGNIAGLNGLLISVAREFQIDGICLLGEIPFFTVQIEYPKAAIAILNVLTKMLGISIDTMDLELMAAEKEKEIAPLAALLAKEQHIDEEEDDDENKTSNDPLIPDEEKIPKSVRVRIEKLFKQAEFDRTYKSKMRLKEELDYYNVFDDYLDRFLDLFKKSRDES